MENPGRPPIILFVCGNIIPDIECHKSIFFVPPPPYVESSITATTNCREQASLVSSRRE